MYVHHHRFSEICLTLSVLPSPCPCPRVPQADLPRVLSDSSKPLREGIVKRNSGAAAVSSRQNAPTAESTAWGHAASVALMNASLGKDISLKAKTVCGEWRNIVWQGTSFPLEKKVGPQRSLLCFCFLMDSHHVDRAYVEDDGGTTVRRSCGLRPAVASMACDREVWHCEYLLPYM